MYHNISIIRIVRQYTLMINKNCRKVCAIFFSSCVLLRSTSCYCKQSQHDPRDMDLAGVHLLYDTIVCLIKSQPTSAIRNTHKKKKICSRSKNSINSNRISGIEYEEGIFQHPSVRSFYPPFLAQLLGNYGKTIRFRDRLIYNPRAYLQSPDARPRFLWAARRLSSRMDFHIITYLPRRGSPTWNTSLFARDSAKNFLPTAISLPLLFLLNFFLPPSYAD